MSDIALKTENIVAGYVRGLPILHNISVSLPRASISVIIGPNGAGKSTLIKAIAGIVPVSSGNIFCGNKRITGIRPDQMGGVGIAYVPQTDNIFRTLTISQNLDLALRHAGVETNERRQVLFEQFPPLADKRNEKAGALSGGQRQMLAVALALAVKPEIIMMDEPSAGLSPKAAGEVLQLVRDLADGGVSILLVEQNVNQALRIADHCYILAEGRHQIDGKAHDLINDPVVGQIYIGGKRMGAA